jgi:hypothetical protein
MALAINVVCRNYKEDRVLPRFARYLAEQLGGTLTAAPAPTADLIYLMGYFEAQLLPKQWPDVPIVSYFTHREEEPPGNAKAKLFDDVARRVSLRVAMCRLYAEPLGRYGPTIQPPLPVEQDRFTISKRATPRRPVVGFSGYTYANHRKGEDLVQGLLAAPIGQRVEWVASGRGWPVPTKRYAWAQLPSFYQGLDVLVCPSRVEGGPLPVLEALACGVRVVVPRGVGLLDELPDTPGIYRYQRGDVKTLLQALEQAAFPAAQIDRAALRAAVAGHTVGAFVEAHRQVFATLFAREHPELDAGMAEQETAPAAVPTIEVHEPMPANTKSKRGIYVVAFGEPSRKCAARLLTSIKQHMPDIPICLCAAAKIGPEDVFVQQPDSDIGGRRAKLKAYELAPAEWAAVLYLDADTEVVAPIYQFFEWIEAGWELVITKDPHLMDTLHAFERRNNKKELFDMQREVHTLHTLQWNGGVWAFARNPRVASFFQRWQAEWEVHAQRDQGALVRAMYRDPLRVLTLGNEWNTFDKYSKGVTTAGLRHYPGDARRWDGLVPGRIDAPEAWAMVKRHEQEHGRRQR